MHTLPDGALPPTGCWTSRLRKNSIVAQYTTINSCALSVLHSPAGCAKRPSSSSVARDTSFVSRASPVSDPDEIRFTIHASRISRTPLADFFRILLVIAPCALDGLRVRLRRPYLRKSTADFGLKRLATALVNHPGYVPSVAGSSSADVRGSERADDASVNRSASSQSWRSCPSCRPRR